MSRLRRKGISVQAAKAKGRELQKWVVGKILEAFPLLTERDVRSTSMGASGEDVQLSELAFKYVPYSIECKRRKEMKTLYSWYEQAQGQNKGEPVVFLRADRKKALALVDAEHFINMIQDQYYDG